jgi:hypothetical protein
MAIKSTSLTVVPATLETSKLPDVPVSRAVLELTGWKTALPIPDVR